jgi:hypothetical protein
MKNFLLLLFIAVTSLFSAQIQKHVTIKYDVKSLPNNEYEAVITANIDKGWQGLFETIWVFENLNLTLVELCN